MALFCALFVEIAGFNSLIFDKLHQLWQNEMFPNRFKSFVKLIIGLINITIHVILNFYRFHPQFHSHPFLICTIGVCVCVCACVSECVWERESVCVCVCVCVRECVWESVCVCVCVCVRESVCVCVSECVRECVRVCVFLRFLLISSLRQDSSAIMSCRI